MYALYIEYSMMNGQVRKGFYRITDSCDVGTLAECQEKYKFLTNNGGKSRYSKLEIVSLATPVTPKAKAKAKA